MTNCVYSSFDLIDITCLLSFVNEIVKDRAKVLGLFFLTFSAIGNKFITPQNKMKINGALDDSDAYDHVMTCDVCTFKVSKGEFVLLPRKQDKRSLSTSHSCLKIEACKLNNFSVGVILSLHELQRSTAVFYNMKRNQVVTCSIIKRTKKFLRNKFHMFMTTKQ